MAEIKIGPAPLDLAGIRAGDQNEITITLTKQGAPMDLTGLTVTSQARGHYQDTESLDAVITVTDAVNGVLTMRWPGDDVRDWLGTEDERSGVWDLQGVNGSGDPVTYVAGSFQAEWDVTR